jgi:hypothetical protein
MPYYMVTLNGVPLRKWMDKGEAEAMAERWQGSHGGYRGGSGLLKIADRGDHVEVKEDRQANREFDDRYKVAKAGERQTVNYEQRVESMDDADPEMVR